VTNLDDRIQFSIDRKTYDLMIIDLQEAASRLSDAGRRLEDNSNFRQYMMEMELLNTSAASIRQIIASIRCQVEEK
jgi:hypothetical protein